MMNYDRTLIEAQKRKAILPNKQPEKDYLALILVALGIVVVILLLFG